MPAFIAFAASSTSGTKRMPSRKSMPTMRMPSTSASFSTLSGAQPRSSRMFVPSAISSGQAVVEVVVHLRDELVVGQRAEVDLVVAHAAPRLPCRSRCAPGKRYGEAVRLATAEPSMQRSSGPLREPDAWRPAPPGRRAHRPARPAESRSHRPRAPARGRSRRSERSRGPRSARRARLAALAGDDRRRSERLDPSARPAASRAVADDRRGERRRRGAARGGRRPARRSQVVSAVSLVELRDGRAPACRG